MLADKLRLYVQATSIVAEQSAYLVLIEGARPIRRFKFLTCPCALAAVPQLCRYWQVEGLPESCPRNGVHAEIAVYPPAALVSSADTILI